MIGRQSKTLALSITGSLLVVLGGCGGAPEPPVVEATAEASAEATTSTSSSSQSLQPEVSASPSQSQSDFFRNAVNRASSAVSIGQSAHSEADWQLAANRWQQAIELMKQVPATSENYAVAQTKIQEYQNHLQAAQQRASGQPSNPPIEAATEAAATPNGLVAQIPILQRRGGTPVVPVTMKGQKGTQEFTMLFDTGATGTLITPAMANALGVVVVDQATVTIADGSQVTMPIGYVDFIEVGGLRREGVLVAIGGNVGLLGQDIYGEFGISMGSKMINLYK